ncbi:MAG: CPBP family intramembrane glutamic endopeptidase [Chloroflexota bacterium]
MAYLLSWLVWGSVIAQDRGLIGFHIPQGLALWGVFFASVIVALATGGRDALMDLARRALRWRVAPIWYAVVLLVPAGIVAVSVAAAKLLGDDVPVGVDMPLGSAVAYFATGVFFFTLTEETGWRGFVLPRLQSKFTPLAATLVLAAGWTVWHLPLWFIADSPQAAWPFLGFAVLVLAQSVLMTWVFDHARGSVLLMGIFHAAADASLSFGGSLSGSSLAFWVTVAVYVLAAGAVVLRAPGALVSLAEPTRRGPAAVAG